VYIKFDKILINNENFDYKIFLQIRACLFDLKNNENNNINISISTRKLNEHKFEKLNNSFYFHKVEKNKNKYFLLNRFSPAKKFIKSKRKLQNELENLNNSINFYNNWFI